MFDDVLTAKEWAGLSMRPPIEQVIKGAVNFLLGRLYIPTEEGVRVDGQTIEQLGLNMEPINWGDLECVEVQKSGDQYIATVGEVGPDARSLISYLEDWLTEWGWPVEVKTEW